MEPWGRERRSGDFFFLILFVLRERESVGEGHRERIPSRLRTVSAEPNEGVERTNCEIMT